MLALSTLFLVAVAAAEEVYVKPTQTLSNNSKKPFNQHTLEELNELTILQRLKLHNWTLEATTLGFTAAFVVLFFIGDWYNKNRVVGFLTGVKSVFTDNFFQFGVSPTQLYVKDSSENYSSYATGRAHIASVDLTFRLKPRHNFFLFIMETVLSFFTESVPTPVDRVDIVITPSQDAVYDNFIQAIVSKFGMNDYRKFNYFLSLTKTIDSADIPESFVFMTEVNDIQEHVTNDQIRSTLTLDSANYIRFIAFTDQPTEKPEKISDLLPRRRIVISTNLVTGKAQLEQLSNTLRAVFKTIDALATKTIKLQPETLRKVVKTREVEVAKIQKLIDAARAEAEAEEKLKLKQQEKDKFRNLSREEQIKAEKKAQEKRQRKQIKKQKVRM